VAALYLDDARLSYLAAKRHFTTPQIKFTIVHSYVEEAAKFKTVTLKSALRVERKFAFAVLFHC
jgi:hypothetical protein